MKYGKFIDAPGSFAFQLDFLSKAVSTNETRYFMKYIHIEKSDKGEGLLGVATDGRRLHLIDPFDVASVLGMTPGYWEVLRGAKRNALWTVRLEDCEVNGWHFPDWRKVIPQGKATYTTTFEGFSMNGYKGNFGELAKFIHDFPDATAINLEYLHNLGTGFTWNVEWYGPSKALKFTEGNRMALIQPMLID